MQHVERLLTRREGQVVLVRLTKSFWMEPGIACPLLLRCACLLSAGSGAKCANVFVCFVFVYGVEIAAVTGRRTGDELAAQVAKALDGDLDGALVHADVATELVSADCMGASAVETNEPIPYSLLCRAGLGMLRVLGVEMLGHVGGRCSGPTA